MSKHTPGPWKVWSDPVGATEVGPSPNYIVSIVTRNPDQERLPNARLIAAAPDLLSALCALMDAVGDMPADASECWPEEWEAACAAIAKAEGTS